jgi:hypothetical protein
MAYHCEILKELSSRSLSELLDDESHSVALMSRLASYAIVDIRRDTTRLHGGQLDIHRLFICSRDSREYVNVGWILSQEIPSCMICAVEFSWMQGIEKHHCRACGNVICENCSPNEAVVDRILSCGAVRVCNFCSFGQSPVVASFNKQFGESVLIVEDVKEDQFVSREEKHLSSSLSSSLSVDNSATDKGSSSLIASKSVKAVLTETNDESQLRATALHSLESIKDSIRLKDYPGSIELQEATPVYLMKVYYTIPSYEADQNIHRSLSRRYSSVANSRSHSFLYINLCSCDSIPYRTVPTTKKPTDEIFSLVFTPLTARKDGTVLIDCGMNPELITDLSRLPEICLQVLAGVSIQFPDYSFDHYQLFNDEGGEMGNPIELAARKTSTNREIIHKTGRTGYNLPVPPLEAMKGLKYCFSSMNDSLLGEFWEGQGFSVSQDGKRKEQFYSIRQENMNSDNTTAEQHRLSQADRRRQRELQFQQVIRQFLQFFKLRESELFVSSDSASILLQGETRERKNSFLSQIIETRKTSFPTVMKTKSNYNLNSSSNDQDSDNRSTSGHSSTGRTSPMIIPSERLYELKSQSVSAPSSPTSTANTSLSSPSPSSSICTSPSKSIVIKKGEGMVESVFSSSSANSHFLAWNRKEGGKLLSEESMKFVPELSANSSTAAQLKEYAKQNPSVLLGWQIRLLSQHKAGNSDSDNFEFHGPEEGIF